MEELIDKFRMGDHLTDKELKMLLKLYTSLEKCVREMGQRYHFFWKDANEAKIRLTQMHKARKK